MNNSIIVFLNIKDEDLNIIETGVVDNLKTMVVEKILTEHFCPKCSYRMHSRGIKSRTIKHPILQDGYQLVILLRQRRWRCINEDCRFETNDEFSFVSKSKQTTNLIPYNVCYALKDLNASLSSVAKQFNLSDTTVRNYFMQYVDLKRLPLPEILSIDEVYLNIDDKHKYALVLMDFTTREVIDLVISRRQVDTQKYFLSIPLSERNQVKYLVCDMYNPYLEYTKSYFMKSVAIIDSFHVLAWLINKINIYINQVKKKYQDRDKEKMAERNHNTNNAWLTMHDSKEVFALKKFKWVMLKNRVNIDYKTDRFYYSNLGRYVDTFDIEELFLSLDPNFPKIRELKELYVDFNSRNFGKEDSAAIELNELIHIYKNCEQPIFREFAQLLYCHFDQIVHSFKIVTVYNNKGEEILRRISNGPMESFNRKPKDLKRQSRGFSNFEFTRLRILWSERDNAPILSKPKRLKEIGVLKEETPN